MNSMFEEKRKETRFEVQTYLDRLKYALNSNSVRISYQSDRKVDRLRNLRFTNRFTLGYLFPDENETVILKRELTLLTLENYIETVKDKRFPSKSDLRVFGKQYSNNDVYIKIRVELASVSGENFILVLSFHYSEWEFKENDFPYKVT